VSGSVVFHGVGTGKTITAVVASHYYLSLYPHGNVIIISPPALILNFVNGLKQYGLNIEDNRYSFKSFEQFSRNPIVSNTKTLIIVDESHILRTQIAANEQEDERGNKTINVTSNKRGYSVLEACKKADKAILLTATPFINKLYDIENLLSMIDKKEPLNQNNFYEMITNTSSRNDYFNYKISHYENPPHSEFFPEKIQEYVPLVMDDAENKTYERFDKGDSSVVEEEGIGIIMNAENDKALTSFYNGTRQYSDVLGGKKTDYIIERIQNARTTGQFIIYATFITNGLNKLKKELSSNDIKYSVISGGETSDKKEDAKNKYNSGEVQVLLISKAGTEGIDTINTEAVFIYEGSQWNEPLVEQAIARAVRYKSHYHLPKSQQKVWIYRLLIIKKSDEDLINKVNQHKIFNFGALNKNLVEQGKQLARLKQEVTNIDEDADIIINNKNTPNDLSQNVKNKIDFKKEEYRKLSPEQKQEYISKIKYNRYETDNKINTLFKERPSVEARLTILSLAKKEQIVEFIKELDTSIQQLEDYTTPYEVEINSIGESK
jgi:superfamily II DNA or RNA helicase